MGVAYNSRITTDGLVLCLDAANTKSYPGSGTTWTDLSTNGNTGTLVNGPTYNSANGGSLSFDNTASKTVIIPDSSIIKPTSITLSSWVFMSVFNPLNDFDGSFPTIAWKCYDSNGGGNSSYGLSLASGSPRFAVSPTTLISATALPLNVWTNIVGTYSAGGNMVLYINGSVNISTTGPASIPHSTQEFAIGTRIFNGTYQYPWNGRISNTSIYNRALSAAEVSQNYNALKSRFGL